MVSSPRPQRPGCGLPAALAVASKILDQTYPSPFVSGSGITACRRLLSKSDTWGGAPPSRGWVPPIRTTRYSVGLRQASTEFSQWTLRPCQATWLLSLGFPTFDGWLCPWTTSSPILAATGNPLARLVASTFACEWLASDVTALLSLQSFFRQSRSSWKTTWLRLSREGGP
jgi:hypothetical protein